jgi:hypothetical protein
MKSFAAGAVTRPALFAAEGSELLIYWGEGPHGLHFPVWRTGKDRSAELRYEDDTISGTSPSATTPASSYPQDLAPSQALDR